MELLLVEDTASGASTSSKSARRDSASESNHPEHLAGEGNRGRRLAALLGRQGTYSAPASQLPSHAKTIARPKTIARTQDNQRQEAAPFEDSRRRQRSQDVYQCTGFGHRARPHTCHSRHVWLTWGRRLEQAGGASSYPGWPPHCGGDSQERTPDPQGKAAWWRSKITVCLWQGLAILHHTGPQGGANRDAPKDHLSATPRAATTAAT